jgi:hypothetical protein
MADRTSLTGAFFILLVDLDGLGTPHHPSPRRSSDGRSRNGSKDAVGNARAGWTTWDAMDDRPWRGRTPREAWDGCHSPHNPEVAGSNRISIPLRVQTDPIFAATQRARYSQACPSCAPASTLPGLLSGPRLVAVREVNGWHSLPPSLLQRRPPAWQGRSSSRLRTRWAARGCQKPEWDSADTRPRLPVVAQAGPESP